MSSSPENETKPRVLVVDDHEMNRDMLARRLLRRGYEVVAVEGGAEALQALESDPYDLVLLDLMMPEVSGIDVLRELRKTRSKAELPVVMTTAKTESSEVVKALGAGANDYVTKPIDFPVLVARVESHLAIREASVRPVVAVPASGDILPETVIDERYKIHEVAGEGGFAIVYRATQLSTGQTVAFKCMRPERTRLKNSASELLRFEQEMKAIRAIQHPNVVRLIDSGMIPVQVKVSVGAGWSEGPGVDGAEPDPSEAPTRAAEATSTRGATSGPAGETPYLVMEYLDGETLQQRFDREGPLAVVAAVDLLVPVLSALSAAHQSGVIHRDVKPQNVVLTVEDGDEVPKVLDFGVAKYADPGQAPITVHEAMMGTPEYMAPEQAEAFADLDARVDQFSAGAMLFHGLTGRRPYMGATFLELVRKVSRADYPKPSSLVSDIPPDLEAVVLRAMAKDRDDRFSSVETFANALLPFASDPVRQRWQQRFPRASVMPPPMPSEPPVESEPPLRPSSQPTLSLKAKKVPLPESPAPVGRWLVLGLVLAAVAVAGALLFGP
ncbi:MAG: response regulator [Myxococcota bacterium]